VTVGQRAETKAVLMAEHWAVSSDCHWVDRWAAWRVAWRAENLAAGTVEHWAVTSERQRADQ